ncbi:hypothetical protein NDU88_002016 [Pleurodeles waltl]|uniref:Uncharacterized protein n=1 Tax=Pleurodeles waltl TaxID=8319 RepID=A0AAV7TJG4_PLEWA|nr:hypothetical protein NDU88_002016 [Pleurodeles waltl]
MARKHTVHADTRSDNRCAPPDAWRHREGDRGAKISRPAQAPSFPTERAWLEGRSRVKGNRLTSRRTVRSSLHEILRSPEDRILHDGPTEEPGRPKKCKPTETEVRSLYHLHRHPSPPLSINRKPSEDRNTPPHRDIKRNHLSSSPP